MAWIRLVQDRDQWRDLVNTVINLRVPYNLMKSLSSWWLLDSQEWFSSMELVNCFPIWWSIFLLPRDGPCRFDTRMELSNHQTQNLRFSRNRTWRLLLSRMWCRVVWILRYKRSEDKLLPPSSACKSSLHEKTTDHRVQLVHSHPIYRGTTVLRNVGKLLPVNSASRPATIVLFIIISATTWHHKKMHTMKITWHQINSNGFATAEVIWT
jgi:hypothetical protein